MQQNPDNNIDMTRVTNFGRKRTHVQAGFNNTTDSAPVADPEPAATTTTAIPESGEPGEPPAKKRKRKRGKSVKNEVLEGTADDARATDPSPSAAAEPAKKKKKEKAQKPGKTFKDKRSLRDKRFDASESRRLQRIAERNSDTTCFACREKGHAARDCPNAPPSGNASSGRSAVGMCYRCGSDRHTLSRCGKPVDPMNPMPFASCFVCSGKGHLAGACPQNKERGVYPNGGCCKLCGDKSHLAKDCGLKRQQDANQSVMVLGTGSDDAGADEDDFHVFKRRTVDVEKEEKLDERRKKLADVQTALQSQDTLPSRSGLTQAPQKQKKAVVFF